MFKKSVLLTLILSFSILSLLALFNPGATWAGTVTCKKTEAIGCYGDVSQDPAYETGFDWCCPKDQQCGPQGSFQCVSSQKGNLGTITPNSSVFKYTPTVVGMRQLFSNVIAFFTIAGGVVVLFLLVSGGIAYMTSGGDAKATGAAQSKITHALIGLAILILSTVIFGIISRLLGVDFLKLPWPTAPQ